MKKTNRQILAYDMDGCLCKEVCWTPEECLKVKPNEKVIEHCNGNYETAITIIYTARKDELIPATIQWLRKHGVRYWAISNQKLHFDLLIDDCVMNVKSVL
jgi:hypothetical protein